MGSEYTIEPFANLRYAKLQDTYLQGVNLRGSDLVGAHLEGSDLYGANLEYSDMTGAYLQGAGLAYANLRGADLTGANLQGADLSYANLRDARLCSADLARANITGACLEGVDLYDTTLEDAIDFNADIDPDYVEEVEEDKSNHTDTHWAIYVPMWREYAGIKVWRITGSEYVGAPVTEGDKNSRRFNVWQVIDDNEVFQCQVLKKELFNWLCIAADQEGCTPHHWRERATGEEVAFWDYTPPMRTDENYCAPAQEEQEPEQLAFNL